jgi:hypothetical protein
MSLVDENLQQRAAASGPVFHPTAAPTDEDVARISAAAAERWLSAAAGEAMPLRPR